MSEDAKTVGWRGTSGVTAAAEAESTRAGDPFACPYCGQMLAAACRVCVSCRQAIDPAAVQRARPAVVVVQPVQPRRIARVPFPWKLFLLVLFVTWASAVAIGGTLGLEKIQLVLLIVQLISSVWVLYDGYEKRLPKPFRWAIATLLFWAFIFPWYLARRRAPEASCPFVEAEASRVSKLLLLALCLTLIVILALRGGPLR